MTQAFEREMEELKQAILRMGGQAESAVARAVKALVNRDDELARQVKEDDSLLDDFEVKVDEMAIGLLAQAPLATHLRFITVAMKISNNLERVGDEATTIARRAIELSQEPQLKEYVAIPRMAEMALKMLAEALDSFVHHKPDVARAIIPADKQVDQLNREVQRELTSFMMEDSANIRRCLNLMVISKSLERIADHASNIAEDVVYLEEAKDIRHTRRPGAASSPGESTA